MKKISLSAALSTLVKAPRFKRWVHSLLACVAVFVVTASAQAVSYSYTLPNQTWGRPPASACSGAKTNTTYATLTFKLYGTVSITATRASGTGISLTTYQGSFFPTDQCVNFWDLTNVSATNTVTRSLSYTVPPPFNQPSTFVVVVSGNGAADFGGITVTVTPNSGTTYELVCGGSFGPDYFEQTSAAASLSTTYTPQFGAIGCNSWTVSTTDSWIKNISPASGTGTGSISFTIDANATGAGREGYLTGPGSASVYIYQDTGPSCAYTLSSTSASVVAAASSGSFTVNTTAGCAWTASTASSFVTGVTASGTGTGSVGYNVGANTGPARTATITAGGQTYTINQANGCTYTLSAASASATAAGGAASLTVTPSNAACTWTASSNAAFITGVTASGTGTGTVNYSVGANTSVARSGTLTVAGQTFTVNQASGCTFSVTPTSVTPSSAAGAGSLSITASNAACPWTATNNDSWLAVAPTSGTGSASVTYNVASNVGPSRSGSLTVAGQSVAFTQTNGCSASLSANSTSINGSGGSGSVTLTMSSSACAWTASSNSPWVTLPASGTGTSLVSFTVAAQAGPARTATLTIGGQTFTVSQADACTYAITPSSTSVDAAAGIGSVQITASDAACTWSVSSNAAWLASTTTNGSGSQTISIDYSANVSILRDGTMTIAGKTFTVTQADGCTVSLSSSSTSVGAAGSSGSVTLTMSAQACAWSASTSSDFVSGVSGSGVGNGSVAFSVAANLGPARVGTIAVGSKTFTIDQASGCTASLASTSANTAAAGSTGSVALTMSASTCPWTASSNAGWIGSVTASGTGSAAISYTAAANTGLARSGTLTIAGQTFTVEQADGCSFSLSPTQATAAVAGGLGSVAVTASSPACPFTTSSSASWLTDVTPGTNGSATINYTVAANSGIARSSTLTIAGHSFAIEQGTGCVATLSGQSASIGSSGGSLTIGITLSSPSCTWTAGANHSFISNVAFEGAGSGSVTFDVAANTGVERTGTLTIAGKTVTVTQGDGCSFLINPTGAEVASSSTGPFNFALTASDSSCPWTMSASHPWVTVNTPSGTGSSTLSYSATANVGPARSSSIEVGGRTFTLLQDNGCSASISPSGTIELSAAAQTSQFDLSLSAQTCPWTASSSNSWLTVADTEGTGNGTAHFSVEANVGPERTLQIQLQGDQTVTVRQASGCGVTLPANAASAQPAGGSANFNVTAVSGCGYTAEADVSWLSNVTVTAQGISYDVAASDGVARVGKITVKSTSTEASAVYTITQSSGCVLVLPSAGSTPAASGGLADFEVQSVSGCQFTATTTDTWLEPVTISDGRVAYQAAANVGPARNGKISVTSTDTGVTTEFAVSQASGCTIVLATTELSLDQDGGNGSFDFTTAAGCSINVASTEDWLSGFTHANGHVTFVAAANQDSDRVGTIIVTTTDTATSTTFTVREASGCTVTLPVASAEIDMAGGNFNFGVNTGVECSFQTTTTASWLQNLVVNQAGSVTSFTAQVNTGVARTATITVTDRETQATTTYVVHQTGAITLPVISGQPQGITLVVGETLRLEVVSSGGDLHYQWRKNGVDIPGATAMEYRVMSSTVGDSGSYGVVITNDAGSVTSTTAVVVVGEEVPTGAGGAGGASSGGAGTGNANSGGTNAATATGGANSATATGGANSATATGGANSATATGGANSATATGGANSATAASGAGNEAAVGGVHDSGTAIAGGKTNSSSYHQAGEGQTPSGDEVDSDNSLGGGSCTCTVVGGKPRQLAGGAVALLMAVMLLGRRRRTRR